MSDKLSVEEVIADLRKAEDNWLASTEDYALHETIIARWALRFRAQGVREALEEAAEAVPTNWCDEILTGQHGIGASPYTEETIECVLRRVQSRLRRLVMGVAAPDEVQP